MLPGAFTRTGPREEEEEEEMYICHHCYVLYVLVDCHSKPETYRGIVTE
jgi:hypothetical protein